MTRRLCASVLNPSVMFNPVQSHTLAVSGAALPTYGFDCLPVLTPVRLSGTETLGELFEYTLELKTPDSLAFSPSEAANIELDRLPGTEVTCLIELEGNGHFIPGTAGGTSAANIGASTREITGLVTEARILREEGRSIVYSLTLRPWLHLATLNQDCRLFQNMTVIEISDAVLGAYAFPVEKHLIEKYPKRDIQRQNWESDFAFICRLWQEWGIYFWFTHSDGRHRLVLCDSIGAHKPQSTAYQTIRYEASAGRRIDEEHIHALVVSSALTTGTITRVDYDYTWPRANLQAKRQDPRDTEFANQEHYSWGDYAQPQAGATGLSGDHNRPEQEADFLSLVRVQALRCQGLRASGTGYLRGLVTGQTFRLTHYPQTDANREYLVVSSTLEIENVGEETQPHGVVNGGRRYRCVTHFVVQPTSEVFRSLRTIPKPRVHGPETAVVTGPSDREIWTDAYGRVKVQFHWDRVGRSDERSSCWLRVSSPWQGSEFGATHLPRVGQEVIVDHLRGDPDMPIVTGRVSNGFRMPAWKLPDNQALSGFRSREINGSRANYLVMDDTEGKIQTQLSSDHAFSQLNLGYLTRISGNKGRQDPRGEGFELRTDGDGVARAARGMLITTEARSNAQSHAKDMGETEQRLTQARDLHESLTGLAQQHEAQQADSDQSEVTKAIEAQNDAIRGRAKTDDNTSPEFAEPHLTLASPAGIQTTSAGSTHIASDEHLALTTGDHIGIAAGKSLFATIREGCSIFTYKLGMRLIAAAGKVRIEAQSDRVEIIAKRAVEIIGTTDWIILKAKKGVRLNGGSTELEIGAQGIRGYTDSQFLIHAASHATNSPQVRPVRTKVRPENPRKLVAHYILVEHDTGFALPNQPYRIVLDDGRTMQGTTNAFGETRLVTSNELAFSTVEIFAASEPDTVIAFSGGVVMRDADRPFAGTVANPEKRSTKVAGKATSTPELGPTTEDKPPAFASCDPMNFGLRSHHFVNGASETDTPAGIPMRRRVEYSVTKIYTAAIKSTLKGIDWSGIRFPLSFRSVKAIQDTVQQQLHDALGSGPFGLPRGNAIGKESGSAMPTVVIVDAIRAKKYNMRLDVSASFLGPDWSIGVNESEIAQIIALTDKRKELDDRLGAFADTLYHESRHCQQYFWMFSLLQHFPDDYRDLPNIQNVYASHMSPFAFQAAGSTPLPEDARVHMGLHRMLVFHYYWLITHMQDTAGGEYLKREVPLAEKKACDLLKVTPEIAQKMARFETGYRSQLHEEDAYACAEVVQAYWQNPDDPLVRNPGTCTADYEAALRTIGARS